MYKDLSLETFKRCSAKVLDCIDIVFLMESLILAQDERLRRA